MSPKIFSELFPPPPEPEYEDIIEREEKPVIEKEEKVVNTILEVEESSVKESEPDVSEPDVADAPQVQDEQSNGKGGEVIV